MESHTDAGRTLAILAYHKVGAPPPGSWETWYSIPTSIFEQQLRGVVEQGWEVIDVATFLVGLRLPERLPRRSLLITFDDAFASLDRDARRCLADLGLPAVVFAPTDFIGDWNRFDADTDLPPEPICDWSVLRRLEGSGLSVQSHGASHRPFSKLGREEQRGEAARSKAILEAELGKSVELFSFPYGDAGGDSHALARILEEVGYRGACLYGRGLNRFPGAEPYRLARLAMGPDTDLETELEEEPGRSRS